MRYMKPMKKRKTTYFGTHPTIRARLKQIARENNCSVNFVENTIMARVLNIDIGEAYDDRETPRKARSEKRRTERGNLRDTPVSSPYKH